MGLVSKIEFGANKYIEFNYTSDGIRLSTKFVDGTNLLTKEYVGDLIYINDTLRSVWHDEGRIVFDNNKKSTYQYFINDQQGSTRVVFQKLNGNVYIAQRIDYGVSGEIIAEQGTGQNLLTHLYQSKEWIDGLGFDFITRVYDPYTMRMLQIDGANQFASGFVGMGNNPVNGIDPDGQFWQYAVGAAIGGFSGFQAGRANGAKGWEMAGYIFAGAGIGALTAGIGTAVSSATAAWGTVGSGMASGAVAGFYGGTFNAALAGSSNPVQAGLKGAAIGGAIGGAMGFVFKGSNFEEVANPKDNLTGNPVKSVDEFSEKYFHSAKEEFGLKLEVASKNNLPSGYQFDDNLASIYRVGENGKPIYINGIHEPKLFGKNTLWLSPSVLQSDKQLFRTLGHELIHGWHNSITPFWEKNGSYSNLTESVAHNWSLHQGVSLGVDSNSSLNIFHSYYNKLTLSQIGKYQNSYHWRLNNIFNIYK